GKARGGRLPAPPSRVFQPRRCAGMVGRGSCAAPPAHSHGCAALVRSTGAAVPTGAAPSLADRPVAHRDRGGAGLMSPLPSTDDTLLSVVVPAYNEDRKSTRLNSSHVAISYAVFCLKKKKSK